MTTPPVGDGTDGVVVGIDGSDCALDGARWAAEYAAGRALPLTLVHVLPALSWNTSSTGAPADRVLAAAEAAVRSVHPDLVIRAEAVKGAVGPVLAVAAQSARLLVVGAGAGDQRALGGHAARAVHRTTCPVLVWRRPAARRTGKPLPVVVGVDDSDASTRALAEAFDIAAALHAPLTVAHLWEIAEAVGMGDLGGQDNMDWTLLDMLQSRQRQHVDDVVAPLAKKYPNVHVDKIFEDASPAKGLAELSQDAQLLVVGSHGRGRLANALLGSVSQSLLHHGECPVLVVR